MIKNPWNFISISPFARGNAPTATSSPCRPPRRCSSSMWRSSSTSSSGESGGVRDYEVSSIFIGGGTPSVLPGEYILGILQATADYFDVRKDAEITLEANPGTLDEHKLQCYREGGVNRISLGLQSADDWELHILGGSIHMMISCGPTSRCAWRDFPM